MASVVAVQGVAGRLTHLRERFRRHAALLYPLVAVVGLITWFSVRSEGFLTAGNASNIGREAAILMLLALAQTLVMLMGSIDLSVAGNATLAGVVFVEVANRHGLYVGVVVTLVVGIAIGVANGGLMLLLRIPSFLVTLGMLSLTLGLATTISHATPVLLVDFAFPDFVNGSAIRGIPNVVVLTLLVLAAIVVVTSCTRYGRALYAIGGGEEISAFSGVRVRTYKMVTFALAGLLCALAGLIFAGQAGTSLSGIGGGIGGGRVLLDCIAAVVMGGTALSGGIGGPQRTAIGVLLIAVLSNGMDLLGLSEAMQEVVEGVAIIAAVALTIDRKKYGIIK